MNDQDIVACAQVGEKKISFGYLYPILSVRGRSQMKELNNLGWLPANQDMAIVTATWDEGL